MQKSLSSANLSPRVRRASRRRSGFTLLEIVVVLAIGALISSITLSGFKELTEGNKRTSCQTNLTQIYQGLRLYMNDEGGNAPLYYHQYTDSTGAAKVDKNIGLWALWTFPRDGNINELPLTGDKPISRYVRNAKVFHCPADDDAERLNLEEIDPTDPNGRKRYNAEYLSYQVKSVADPLTNLFPTSTNNTTISDADRQLETYMPSRITNTGTTPFEQRLWRRQLDHVKPNPADATKPLHDPRQPTDNTVVTWCPWHRPPFGNRDRDIVLFMDGSVQQIPRVQENLEGDNCTPNATVPTLENWQRTPKLPQCTY